MLHVNIKYNSNWVSSVDIEPSDTVRELKQRISDIIHVPVHRLGLILGGQLLQDDVVLQNCAIGQQSVLHAFQQKIEAVTTSVSSTDAGIRTQYFVYCKLCKALRPAKLRVKCALCKDGAFVVERGPENWDDVLQSTRIKGSCQNVPCSGNIAEFHFKCTESHFGDVDETAVILQHVYPNWRHIECICCASVRSPVLVFPCEDGHVSCLECFKLYGITKLDERKFVKHDIYTLPCPAGCSDSFIKESHHFHLLGDDQYERYNRFAAEEYVLQHDGVLCPGPGCGMGMMMDFSQRKVTCVSESCQMTFCRDCHTEYHDGPCHMRMTGVAEPENFPIDRDQAERARWEFQTEAVIKETTKPCPQCHTRTERDGGCMHMVCTQCRLEWCWMCQKQWDNDCVADHWFG